MGLFCVNFHFRTTDEGALNAALDRRGVLERRVLGVKGDWISLYEARASEQDETRIRELAGDLSQDLQAPAIAFLVHDSDVACYWLFDRGRLLDEYNSCPDYFDESFAGDEPGGPCGGQAGVLQPYCRDGVSADHLTAILTQQATFADDVVGELAEVLGIDPERALSDYRDYEEGTRPDGGDGFGGDDGDGDGPHVLPFPSSVASQLVQKLGGGPPSTKTNPQARALVEAAAAGDIAQIERLLAQGAAVDAEAPAALPQGQPAAGLGQLFPGGLPQFPMTPLLAAVVHQRQEAASRLLDAGADPNHVHPLFGTPLHAATGAGYVELLRLLIDRGGSVRATNRQGQTPLAVVAVSRGTLDRLAQARAMMKTMGMKLPAILDNLSSASLPTAGWDACEKLLVSRGAI